MTEYVAASWSIYDQSACTRGAELRRTFVEDQRDWRVLIDLPGFLVAERVRFATSRSILLPGDAGVLIGVLFDRAATEQGTVAPARIDGAGRLDARGFCETLSSSSWGAYVAILRGAGSAVKVFRDPMGTLDCLSWWSGGLLIVSSIMPEWLLALAPAAFKVNWDAVAGFLGAAPSVADTLGLTGVLAIPPGTLVTLHRGGRESQALWSPRQFCMPPAPADPRRLATLVDGCTAAWASLYDHAVAELSGGLDSAIVAGALPRASGAPVRAWYNYFVEERQGDERAFARAVASRLGLPLVEIPRDRRAIDETAFAGLAAGARPGLTGMDVHQDRDLGERSAGLGAQAIFTGQGGDAVFFQMPTALIAAELLADNRTRAEKAAMVMRLARWTRQPVWTLLATAWRGNRAKLPLRTAAPPFVVPRAAPCFSPWLDGTAHLPPAKRLQIWGLANSRLYFGESYRSRHTDVVHPLMSQPLVEHMLAIPVLDLTRGRRDRALAREAFASRLPEEVIARRGKGDLTSYYGRLVAASLDFLRPHLLEGCLAREGLIDRAVLESMLDPQRLIHQDWYAEILSAAIIESWARTWEARIVGFPAGG